MGRIYGEQIKSRCRQPAVWLVVAACILIFRHSGTDTCSLARAGSPVEGNRQPLFEAASGDAGRITTPSENELPVENRLHFIENQGQAGTTVKFYISEPGRSFLFTAEGLRCFFPGGPTGEVGNTTGKTPSEENRPGGAAILGLYPQGMEPTVQIIGSGPREGKVNVFRGSDPNRWHRNIPTFEAVIYREAYPGVDLKFYGRGPFLEYDLFIKPSADISRIRFRLDGAQRVETDPEGNLVITLPGGATIVHQKPVIHQSDGTEQHLCNGGFVLYEETPGLFGFHVEGLNPALALVIDPVIVYSTHLGGDGMDVGQAIAVDGTGHAYVAGYTYSIDFPVTDGAVLPINMGWQDVFVTKMNTDGSGLVYSTYLGGSEHDSARAIAVDAAGNAYIAGDTRSGDFPTRNGFQSIKPGGHQDKTAAFVAKLNPDGSDLVYSTYLGGSGYWDSGRAVAVDKAGRACITGKTASRDFPLKNQIQSNHRGGSTDAFVTKLSSTGSSIVYSTYLGGDGEDSGNGIAVNKLGQAYVVGETGSSDFPTECAMSRRLKGAMDAFVAKLDTAGSDLIFSTYLGGSGDDRGVGIALDPGGYIYVTGDTFSGNFPIKGAFQRVLKGTCDVFVTKLYLPGSPIIYSTFLGGSAPSPYTGDRASGISVNAKGIATVMGWGTENFPMKNPYWKLVGPDGGPFVTRFSATGSSLVYSTFLGLGTFYGRAMALDPSGNVYITGETDSGIGTTPGAFQPLKKIGNDGVVIKFGNPSP